MHRMWVALAVAVVLGTLSVVAWAAPRGDVELVFQQNVNGYAGCRALSARGEPCQGERANLQNVTFVFGDLRLSGNEVKVTNAELRMHFLEEGYSRIRNADLELYDAAVKDGPAVATAAYRGGKFATIDEKTRMVSWKLPADLIARWVEKPETNQGLRIVVKPAEEGQFEFSFSLPTSAAPAYRPELVVAYSFTGEVAPFPPDLLTRIDGKTLGPRFTIAWKKKRWDPNGTPVTYEIAVAPKDGGAQTVGKADAEAGEFELDTTKLATDKLYELRARAVDPTGLASDWTAAPGEFRVTRSEYLLWAQDSATKVGREAAPPQAPAPAPITLAAARNETESFQIVISALGNLKGVDVAVSDLTGPGDAKIPASAATLYRVHYVDCMEKGLLPDSLVPFVNPKTGARIGGVYGAPFDVTGGINAPVWVEYRVSETAAPGDYKGEIKVTLAGAGKPAATLPIALTVWPVTLPKTTTLLTYFNLGYDTPSRDYLKMLHEYRIDVWGLTGLSHSLKRDAGGKPVMQWKAELDAIIDDYFSGKLFADGVPGKTILCPVARDIEQALRGSDEDRIAVLKQYEAHYKDKPWVKRCSWFFIDEPNAQTLRQCQTVGRQIKEYSPSIPFLLTTRYNKDLVGLVDVWDAIINAEVINWGAPGPEPYREEMKLGRRVINCVTVTSDQESSPNIFIHHSAMNARIWPWVTFALDQQGIEYWQTRATEGVVTPRKFGPGCWGDGSLFYKGVPADLGIPEEIPLPSLRLKAVRDGIEDFELLALLRAKNPALARALVHKMAQETKDYDRSFAAPVQQTTRNWDNGGKGEPVTGFIVWESSTKRLAEVRAAIAKAIAEAR